MGKRAYSLEFRREAFRKTSELGAMLSQVMREIGIKQQTLHRWKKFDSKLPAVVLDLYSRRAVGWSMNANLTAQLVTNALTMPL